MHKLHVLEPSALDDPDVHCVQVALGGEVDFVPALHNVHSLFLVELGVRLILCPAAQLSQPMHTLFVFPAVEYFPASHGVHV